MISLLPAFHETIVLPKPAEDVYRILAGATSNKPFIQAEEKNLAFNGWVKQERFRLSQRVLRANNYLPLIIGELETTSTGCILFVDYQLFPTTRYLLLLWNILLILGSITAAFQEKSWTVLLTGAGIASVIDIIVWSNFRMHLKTTREVLHRLLS